MPNMSVVAGCLLPDGVLLAADTRITYTQPDGSTVYGDNAIKIFPFAKGTAIGYVGDVTTASYMLQYLIQGRDRRKRTDPMRLYHWIPRILRALFRRAPTPKSVAFMVASSFQNQCTQIERSVVGNMLMDAVKDGLTGLSGTLAFDILNSSKSVVELPNTCASILYTMSSPTFEPILAPPLSARAIGSGRMVVESLRRHQASIIFDDPLSGAGPSLFRLMIQGYVETNDIDGVGGLYPILKVRGDDCIPCGQHTQTHKQGTSEIEAQVELSIEDGRWVQRDTVSGACIILQPPWDLAKSSTANQLFDHIDKRRWHKPQPDRS